MCSINLTEVLNFWWTCTYIFPFKGTIFSIFLCLFFYVSCGQVAHEAYFVLWKTVQILSLVWSGFSWPIKKIKLYSGCLHLKSETAFIYDTWMDCSAKFKQHFLKTMLKFSKWSSLLEMEDNEIFQQKGRTIIANLLPLWFWWELFDLLAILTFDPLVESFSKKVYMFLVSYNEELVVTNFQNTVSQFFEICVSQTTLLSSRVLRWSAEHIV